MPKTDARISIIIASAGRPVELGRWLDHVERQTLKPLEMIWAVASDSDLPDPINLHAAATPMKIIRCARGCTVQRNYGLEARSFQADFIVFFDDDYVPSSTCLQDIVDSFDALPDVVGLTGTLLADGIGGPGIGYEDAMALIAKHERSLSKTEGRHLLKSSDELYGCNMAFRSSAIGEERFDERLPLYSWQEDVDFAFRVAKGRKIGFTRGFFGVHQGVKYGRTGGRRLGYSQIINPVYLYRKGTMKFSKCMRLVLKNLLANHMRSLKPESWVDRRGRVAGNWIGIFDLLRGRINPERVLDL